MATTKRIGVIGGDQLKLAPDLDLPSRLFAGNDFERVTFDPSTGGLVEGLGLSGKWAVYGLSLTSMPTAELCTVKLTVDSVVIWNDVDFTPGSTDFLLYGRPAQGNTGYTMAPFIVEDDLSLEVETVADSSVVVTFIARPIK